MIYTTSPTECGLVYKNMCHNTIYPANILKGVERYLHFLVAFYKCIIVSIKVYIMSVNFQMVSSATKAASSTTDNKQSSFGEQH